MDFCLYARVKLVRSFSAKDSAHGAPDNRPYHAAKDRYRYYDLPDQESSDDSRCRAYNASTRADPILFCPPSELFLRDLTFLVFSEVNACLG